MALYTRHQLAVLVALLATAGTGLAVDHWRRGHPALEERIEQLDREIPAETAAQWTRPGSAAAASPSGRPRVTPAAPIAGAAAAPRPAKLKVQDGREAGPARIDLNTATAEDLARLPGVGPALAARIVEARDAEMFASVDDLRRVRGVGSAKLGRVRSLVTVAP